MRASARASPCQGQRDSQKRTEVPRLHLTRQVTLREPLPASDLSFHHKSSRRQDRAVCEGRPRVTATGALCPSCFPAAGPPLTSLSRPVVLPSSV